jgi:putative spermidine/putrescine transport system substrate-binding protein
MNEVVGSLLREEGFFEPWPAAKVPNLEKLQPIARLPGDNGVTAMTSPIGIAYRKDLVKNPPTSWKDLWSNPEFKGKLGLFTIGNTGGFMFLMVASKIFGSGPLDFDAGLREVAKLKPFQQADLGGGLSVLLTRGEIVACPLNLDEVANMQKRGVAIGFVAPTEGVCMFDQTFYLLKNGPNKEGACAFLDYVLSEEAQAKIVEEFAYLPLNKNVKLSPSLEANLVGINVYDRMLTFDWVSANRQRAQIAERWNQMIQ